MKLKQILFLTIAIAIQTLNSQSLNLKLGSASPMAGQISFSYFAGIAANHYYFAQVPNVGKSELLIYDLNHKLTSKTNMELDVDGKKAVIERIINTRNYSYAFTRCYDKKEDKSYSFLHKVNTDGKIEALGTLVLESKKGINAGSNPFSPMVNSLASFTGLAISSDSSMLAYVETSNNNENAEQEMQAITVMDENLNKKWSRIITIPYTDKLVKIENVYVCNDGRVVLCASISSIKGYRHEKVAEFRCKLFIVDDKSVKEIDADFSAEVAPNEFGVVCSSGNEFTVCGTYDTKWRYTTGVFMFTADMVTGKINKYKAQPIKMEDLDFGRAKGDLKKKEGVEGIELISGIQLRDGRFIITIAQSLAGSETAQSYDKLIFEFDKDLNPKSTFGLKGWTSERPFNTVMTVPFNDSYLVLYHNNDARGNLFAVYVNSKGEKSQPQMLPFNKMYFKPSNSQLIDDKRVLVEGYAYGNYQFGILSAK